MSVTINGSGTITSSTGTLGFGDENLTTTGNLTGTLTDDLPAISGANLTALNANNLASGTVPAARLGSGTASSSTILYGNNTWGAAPAAGLTLITTVTASSSATIDVNSTLTDTYKNYLITFENITPATNNVALQMLFSTDNGSSYVTSNYQYVYKSFYAGPSGDGNSESTGNSYISVVNSGHNNAADGGTIGNMWVVSPTNSAVRTSYLWDLNSRMGDGSNYHQRLVGSGFVGATADNDAFQFKFSSGNVASGVVRVYGIAND